MAFFGYVHPHYCSRLHHGWRKFWNFIPSDALRMTNFGTVLTHHSTRIGLHLVTNAPKWYEHSAPAPQNHSAPVRQELPPVRRCAEKMGACAKYIGQAQHGFHLGWNQGIRKNLNVRRLKKKMWVYRPFFFENWCGRAAFFYYLLMISSCMMLSTRIWIIVWPNRIVKEQKRKPENISSHLRLHTKLSQRYRNVW